MPNGRGGPAIAISCGRMAQHTTPRTVRAALLAAVLAISGTGCSVVDNPFAPAVEEVLDLASEVAFCVDEVNRFRATIGLRALTRSSRIDSFSTEAARVDTEAREAHKYFRQTNGGGGTSRAQNVVPWWYLSNYGSVRRVTREGLAMMWAEGPGGGHYETMKGNFSEIGCGFFVENGVVTVTQDFR
jgi:uncharacterized protein YkwD